MVRGKSRRRALALVLGAGSLAVGLALTSVDAAGQKPEAPNSRQATAPGKGAGRGPASKGAADAAVRYDPENVIAISEFMEALGKGNAKYDAKDYPGAVDLFKAAIKLNPKHALGPYLLGEAYLAMNNLGEAEAAFKDAAEHDDAKMPLIRSHVLFAVADCYERQKKWEQARTAWQAYTEHATKLGQEAGAHPQSGTARIKAVEDWLTLDKQYEIVRKRIADEKADAGAAAAKPAAPAKK